MLNIRVSPCSVFVNHLKGEKMVIIGNISFPQESANDVGKRFLELPPVPDFMTLKGPYIKL